MPNQSVFAAAEQLAIRSGSPQLAVDLAVGQMAGQAALDLDTERKMLVQARESTLGFGGLQKFLDDPEIEEVWINRPGEVFTARAGLTTRHFVPLNQREIEALVERMLRQSGRRIDRATPFVDAALPDGSRLHVIIPDVARSHWAINIRKFPKHIWSLADLAARGVLTEAQLAFLQSQVSAGANILVSGATQAGKTTLLCALIEQANPNLRLVSVEETFELRSSKHDWVALQTRQANLEGQGEISMRRLVKESLRMRPELLAVGEVREAESLDLLIAMNSGISGMCTIHANSAAAAITKLCTLPLLAGANISADFVRATVAQCVSIVVHCEVSSTGLRRVSQIASVRSVQGEPRAEVLQL